MTLETNATRGARGRMSRSERDVEAQRDFLLRSLADLENEHAAGELSNDRFHELYDEYTTQAAIALRALDRLHENAGESVGTRYSRRRKRITIGTAVVAIIAIAAVVLVQSVGSRQAGQTITGNAQSAAPDLDALAGAARDRPDDPQAQLDYGLALLNDDQPVEALRALDEASRLDPTNPIPQAYAGWIVYLAGLPNQALPRLDEAIAADPSYPDAHFFRGIVLLRGFNDAAAARVELAEYLRLAPPGSLQDQVQAIIDELDRASNPTTPLEP